jgi:hypothetical protein
MQVAGVLLIGFYPLLSVVKAFFGSDPRLSAFIRG